MPYIPVGVVGGAQAGRDLRQFANTMDYTSTRLQSAALRGGAALDALSVRTARLQAQMVAMGASTGFARAASVTPATIGGRYSPMLAQSAAFQAMRQQQIRNAGPMVMAQDFGRRAAAGPGAAAVAGLNAGLFGLRGQLNRMGAGPQRPFQPGPMTPRFSTVQQMGLAHVGQQIPWWHHYRRSYEQNLSGLPTVGAFAGGRGGGMGRGMGMAGMVAAGGGMGLGRGGGGLGAANDAASRLPRVFGTMGRTGMRFGFTLTGVTLGLAAFAGVLRGISGTYSKFEDEMIGSTAIMRGLSERMETQLGSQARVAALGTRFEAPDTAAAEYYLASAGYTPEGVLQAHPVVTTGAQAAKMQIPRFAELATDVTRSAGLWEQGDETATTKALGLVIDQVLHMSRLTDATPEQLFMSLTQLAGIGEATGQPFEQMLGLTGVLANVGQKSSTSRDLGVQLLNRLGQMGSDPKKAQVFEDAGINIFDDEGAFNPLVEILADFEKMAEGQTDEEYNRFLNTAGFGAKSARPMRLLLGEVAEYRRLLKELEDAHGAAAEIAANQLQGLAARWDLSKSKIADSGIALGTAFLPGLSEGLGIVDSINSGIHSWAIGVENASKDLTHYEETLLRIKEMDLEPGLHDIPTVEGKVQVRVNEDGTQTIVPRQPDFNRVAGAIMGEQMLAAPGNIAAPFKWIGDRFLGGKEQENLDPFMSVALGGKIGDDPRALSGGLDFTEEQYKLAKQLQDATDDYQNSRFKMGKWELMDMIPDRETRSRYMHSVREAGLVDSGGAPTLGMGEMKFAGFGGGQYGDKAMKDVSRYMAERFPKVFSEAMSTGLAETEFESWAINRFVSKATTDVHDAMQQVSGGLTPSVDMGFGLPPIMLPPPTIEPADQTAVTEEQAAYLMGLNESLGNLDWTVGAAPEPRVIVPGYGFHEATGGTGDEGEGEGESGLSVAQAEYLQQVNDRLQDMEWGVAAPATNVNSGYGFGEDGEGEGEGEGESGLSFAQAEYLQQVNDRLRDMEWGVVAPPTDVDTSFQMVPWTDELQAMLDDWNRTLGAEIAAWGEEMNKAENRPTVVRKFDQYWVPVNHPADNTAPDSNGGIDETELPGERG